MTPAVPGATLALAVAAGALLSVERKALAQLMLARPLVVAPILATLLGEPGVGLAIGIPLELFFLANASYGASTPDHETWAAIFAACIAAGATSAGALPAVAMSVAVALALPLAPLGRRLDVWMEHTNEGLLDDARHALTAGRTGKASRRALPALVAVGGAGAGITLAGVLLGPAVGRLTLALPAAAQNGLTLAWALFTGVCAAVALRAIRTPGGPALSGLAALAVIALFAAAVWWLR